MSHEPDNVLFILSFRIESVTNRNNRFTFIKIYLKTKFCKICTKALQTWVTLRGRSRRQRMSSDRHAQTKTQVNVFQNTCSTRHQWNTIVTIIDTHHRPPRICTTLSHAPLLAIPPTPEYLSWNYWWDTYDIFASIAFAGAGFDDPCLVYKTYLVFKPGKKET